MATLIPNLDLPALVRDADLIVVGKVARVRQLGPTILSTPGGTLEGRSMVAELAVEKALKGEAEQPSLSFGFTLPDAPSGYQGIGVGQFGVFFLHKAPGGAKEIIDPYHPFVVAAPSAPSSRGSTLDQVTAELARASVSSDASPDTRLRAVLALDTLHTPMGTAALKTAARDEDPTSRVFALAALLKRNDISLLGAAADILLSDKPNVDANLLLALAQAIEFGVKDRRAIPVVARLLRSRDANARRGAAGALRNTKDPAAIKPLTEALYDSDYEVRFSAVAGLAEITGQDQWLPGVDGFKRDERRYLTYWRDWAKSRKGPSPGPLPH